MMLLALTLALVAPYPVLTVVGHLFPAARTEPATRARVGVTLLFLITGAGHFAQPEAMAAMLPPQVPLRVQIIYITGVLELLGAIGVWIPPWRS